MEYQLCEGQKMAHKVLLRKFIRNIERIPDLIGENSPSQGYPNDELETHVKKRKNKNSKKMHKKYITISHAAL